jgi:membrane associated rhomboid family serine protease
MGIENRDYVRGSSSGYDGSGYSGGSYSPGMPPACKWILILTIAVFVVQLVWTVGPSDAQVEQYQNLRTQSLEEDGVPADQIDQIVRQETRLLQRERYSVAQRAFQLSRDKVISEFQLWRLVTYAFCHSEQSVWHIVLNMLIFWFFAPTLERMYGTREFALFYVMGAVAAGLAFIGLEMFLGKLNPVIGASGAVMAVLMLYAIHYPRQVIRIWGIIPIEVRWIVGFYLIVDLFPVLSSIGGRVDNDAVAHSAHLGGLAFGYLYFKFQWRFERLFAGFRSSSEARAARRAIAKGNLKLYQPPDNLDDEVDRILEKISQSGEASLTDDERETLKAASHRYKKRS